MTSIIMMTLASAAFGTGGLMLGQQWSGLAESIRVGSTHLSTRGLRLPINKYPGATFVFAAALSWGIAILRYWIKRNMAVVRA